jgi:polysaccharide biosynthesis protein PslG
MSHKGGPAYRPEATGTLRRVRAAALMLVLCAFLSAPGVAAAERRVPQGFHGVMWDGPVDALPFDRQEAHWDRMAEAGVESVRTVFSWERAQSQPGDPFDFAFTDRLVEWAAERQIELLPVLDNTPVWARIAPSASLSPPARLDAFADFVRALPARYGPGGSFWIERPELPQRPLRAWQVLNEPHFRGWRPGAGSTTSNWPSGYVKVLRTAERALKQSDPGARVVLAGLANDSWNHLRKLYRAGARPYFDIAAQHPYVTNSARVLRAVRRVRRVMKRARDARKRLWLTELGWTASKGILPNRLGGIETTESGVRKRLLRSFRALVPARGHRPGKVDRVHYYTWATTYSGGSAFFYAGLLQLRPGEEPSAKPALAAYVASARRNEGCVKTATGSCAP